MIPYKAELAAAHLRSRKGQAAVIVLGIAFAVTVMSFLANLNEGQLRDVLDRAVEANSPHITLEPSDETLPRTIGLLRRAGLPLAPDDRTHPRRRVLSDHQALAAALARRADTRVVAPYVIGEGFVTRGGREFAATIRGIVPEAEVRLVHLRRQMVAGRLEDLRTDGIVIGRRLRDRLHAALGDRLHVQTPAGERDLRLVGVFDSGIAERDLGVTFVALRTAQQLFALGLAASGLALKLDDLGAADRVARVLREEHPELRVRSWIDDNRTLVNDIATSEGVFFIGNLFVSLMALTGVASVLLMLVMQKTRDIGILMAMGAAPRSIATVFVLEALAVGVLGSLLGVAGGYTLLVHFETHPLGGVMQRVAFEPWFFWRAVLLTLAACVLASVGPARRAARIDPARAVRVSV